MPQLLRGLHRPEGVGLGACLGPAPLLQAGSEQEKAAPSAPGPMPVCAGHLGFGSRAGAAGPSPPSLSQGPLFSGTGTARGPSAYLSTAEEPSGPALLLFLLMCSFFLFKFCFLNQNQQEFIFLWPPWG